MLEKKQFLYLIVFIFVCVIGFQIYVTTQSSANNGNGGGNNNGGGSQCTNVLFELQQQQQQFQTLQKEIKEQSAKLDNIQRQETVALELHEKELDMLESGNGVRSSRGRKPVFTNPSDLEERDRQLEARRNKTSSQLPNTCFPMTDKVICLPNFIIIGAMKAGTTFLDYYLQKHPMIAKHSKKELWFFNSYYSKGIEWYAQHFEPVSSLENPKLIGEATPFYINNPLTAARMFATLKNVKMIFLMRDPVERALSQYYFSIKWIEKNRAAAPGIQNPESFEKMIREEAEVIETCVRGNQEFKDKLEEFKSAQLLRNINRNVQRPDDVTSEEEEFTLKNPFFQFHSDKNWTFYRDCQRCDKCFQYGNILHTSGHPSFGMLAKSLYYEQIDYWLDYFPLDQFLFLRYEDINTQPEGVLKEVEEFLGLPAFDYGEFSPKNAVPHDPMHDEIKQYLIEYFRPHNEKLYKLLNRDFGWLK